MRRSQKIAIVALIFSGLTALLFWYQKFGVNGRHYASGAYWDWKSGLEYTVLYFIFLVIFLVGTLVQNQTISHVLKLAGIIGAFSSSLLLVGTDPVYSSFGNSPLEYLFLEAIGFICSGLVFVVFLFVSAEDVKRLRNTKDAQSNRQSS